MDMSDDDLEDMNQTTQGEPLVESKSDPASASDAEGDDDDMVIPGSSTTGRRRNVVGESDAEEQEEEVEQVEEEEEENEEDDELEGQEDEVLSQKHIISFYLTYNVLVIACLFAIILSSAFRNTQSPRS